MARNRNSLVGFTLLEVVLAIGLTGVVLALLTTAIDLYLVRVDANRTRVETAQLARTLLTHMADDIRAARFWSPATGSNRNGPTGGSNSTDTIGDSAGTTTAGSESATQVQGIFGTATELRIDRAARWRWQRATQPIDSTADAELDDLPQTVQYFFNDGETLLADRLAAMGVLANPTLSGRAGLYRRQAVTVAWVYQISATGVSVATTEQSAPELWAPEVLEVAFGYFDGQQMLEQWDSAQQGRLPRGIEIHLTVLQEPFELAKEHSSQQRDVQLRSKKNAVEYRLYVRLPSVRSRRVAGPKQRSPQQQSGESGDSRGGASDDSLSI